MRPLSRQGLLALACAGALQPGAAQEPAPAPGIVRIEMALEAKTLKVQVETPLDSLLGFGHPPHTPAQKYAVQALQQRLRGAVQIVRPNAAARCSLRKAVVESEAFEAERAAPAGRHDEPQHADVSANYEFVCQQPQQLGTVEIGLFDAFRRVQRIETRFIGPKSQSRFTLHRPDSTLTLAQ